MNETDQRILDLEAQCSAMRAILGCVVATIRRDQDMETALGTQLLHARSSFEEISDSSVPDEATYAGRALDLFKWIEASTG